MHIQHLLEANRKWQQGKLNKDPNYFTSLANQQAPEYFWIGCCDSRVPANQILGLAPGEVFVQRNVGNLATHKDFNCMTCLDYAINNLKVKHVIVCGHYNCGAVKGAINMADKAPGMVNLWISDIKATRNRHALELSKLEGDKQVNRLCELSVITQVFNVCTSPSVQLAWDNGQDLSVYGLAYDVAEGILKELTKPIDGYGSLVLAKEAMQFPEDDSNLDGPWQDQDLGAL